MFVDWDESGRDPDRLGEVIAGLADGLSLAPVIITNRGVKVWPDGIPETRCTDHWRCRFRTPDGAAIKHAEVLALLQRFEQAGLDFIKTEHLYTFDGERGYSLGQGE